MYNYTAALQVALGHSVLGADRGWLDRPLFLINPDSLCVA